MRSRILLLDTDARRGRGTAAALSAAGFATRLARRPHDAWSEPPEAAVVTLDADLDLTARHISWIRSRELFLPVILASPPGTPPADLAPMFTAGANAYLPLPFDAQAARDLIHRRLWLAVLHRGRDLEGGPLPRKVSETARVAETARYRAA